MWRIHGHDAVLRQISRGVEEGQLAHAYLLVGPAHVGKRSLAIQIAQAVNCLDRERAPCDECTQCSRILLSQHADVLLIEPGHDSEDGAPRREIGIKSVRDIQHQASLKPYEGVCRVFIFDGAEHMSEEAANALLKTLEEPPPQVLIILISSEEEALLPTILSRCRKLELRPLPLDAVVEELISNRSVDAEEAGKLGRLSMGCLGWAVSALEDPTILEDRQRRIERIDHLATSDLGERFKYASELAALFSRDRAQVRETLYVWLRWWRDLLLIKEGAEDYVQNIDCLETLRTRAANYSTAQVTTFVRTIISTLEALDRNANPRLALEVFMMELPSYSPVT